jgi:hypothetical protein
MTSHCTYARIVGKNRVGTTEGVFNMEQRFVLDRFYDWLEEKKIQLRRILNG